MIEKSFLQKIEAEIQKIEIEEVSFVGSHLRSSHDQKVSAILDRYCDQLDQSGKNRVLAEFRGLGPLDHLMTDERICEIMVNGPENIWIETDGRVEPVDDGFCSEVSFRKALENLCETSQSRISIDRPTGQGALKGFRVQVVGGELTKSGPIVCLRRHPENPWTLSRFEEVGWGVRSDIGHLKNWIAEGKNFLVLGPTGAGKTSVVNACLQEMRNNERALILEDTQELCLPNKLSQRLLTRQDSQRILPDIDLTELVRQALRLRPDRIIIGEIRGGEAKDLLLALSTGHQGSFGTLHASNPHQGLIRLEMLIQMGAPNWNLQAIRRLIQLSINGLVVVGKDENGQRKLKGLYEISSLEDSGFLIEQVAGLVS